MSIKMRPATQDNVGVSVRELEAREAAAAEAIAATPKEEEPKVETVVETKPVEVPKKVETITVVAKTPVNLRREPRLDGHIVRVLYPGNPIEVEDFNELWYKTMLCSEVCYVMKEFTIKVSE